MHYSTEILLIAINFLTMPFDSARRAASFALVGKLIRACLRKVTFWGLVERFLSIFRSKFSSTTTELVPHGREVSLYFSIEILFYALVPRSGTSFYAKLARFECSDQELSSKYWASMKLEWQEYNALLDRNFTYRNQLSDYAIRLSSSSCIFCTSRKVDSSLSSKSHFLRPCREVSLYFSIEILFYDDGSLCPMVWHVFLRKASSIWMLRSRVIVKILSIDETWVTRV